MIVLSVILAGLALASLGCWAVHASFKNREISDLLVENDVLRAGRDLRNRMLDENGNQLKAIKNKLIHTEARHAKLLTEHHQMKDHLRRLGSLELEAALSPDKNVAQSTAPVQA